MEALLLEGRSTGKKTTGGVCSQRPVITRAKGDQPTNEPTSVGPEPKGKTW